MRNGEQISELWKYALCAMKIKIKSRYNAQVAFVAKIYCTARLSGTITVPVGCLIMILVRSCLASNPCPP